MNSSAELHVALGAPLSGAHLEAGASAEFGATVDGRTPPSARAEVPGQAADAPSGSAGDELERARAEITRLRAELDAKNAADTVVTRWIARLDDETARVADTVRQQLDALASEVVGLALAAAGKVLRTELVSPQFDLGAVVAAALDRVMTGVRANSPVRVRASNHDLQTLDRVTRMHATASERVQLEVDPALAPSQVVIECDLRRVVVDVKAEFERLKAALSAEDDPHG